MRFSREISVMVFVLMIVLPGVKPVGVRGQVQTGTVSGTVYGFTCGNDIVPLTGAKVVATEYYTGNTYPAVATDAYGFYNLTLPAGDYKLFVTEDLFQTEGSYTFTVIAHASIPEFNFYLTPKLLSQCKMVPYTNFVFTVVVYSNASVTDIAYDQNGRLLNFATSVANESVTTSLVVVPKILMDGTPVVLVDNAKVNTNLVEGANFFYVTFLQPVGSHNVVLGGSKTIPEFSSTYVSASVVLCLILSAFHLTRLKRKRR